ncbi:MAG: DUF2844 domain-containing protein [Rhodoferax sp.]|nr:DUF2844 domain-containing protein [Rhodoferax sp.]
MALTTITLPGKNMVLLALLTWLYASPSSPCYAALGSNQASVASEQQDWGATVSTSALPGATLYHLTLGNGLTVREYVDSAGTVFAIGWEGPVLPDFKRLLAAYFASYQQAVRSQQHGVNLNTPALVLESGGRMRAFVGRAYLPAKLPSGISVNAIY